MCSTAKRRIQHRHRLQLHRADFLDSARRPPAALAGRQLLQLLPRRQQVAADAANSQKKSGPIPAPISSAPFVSYNPSTRMN
jgi:chorismate mutase